MTATFTPLPREPGAGHVHETASIGNIAIVDDDESVCRAMARLLGAYSFHVQTYRSGREFIASLNTGVPACLITDLQMGEMTGLELLHHLGQTGLMIPIIIATARDEPGLQRCTELRDATLLVKPVMRDQLLEAIWDAMSRPGWPNAQSGADR